ncbi:methylenetetrahydrofolate reductase [Chloroflexota bacterium]
MAKRFREALEKKDFLVTAEVSPVKGADTSRLLSNIELLKEKVDALNVTDNQSSIMRYPSLGACLLIKENDGESVLQMTCRDRNRMALQSDLLFAYSRGIDNVLCLTGDSIDVGDHKTTKPVFDLDSVQLVQLVHTLNSGKDMEGNELDGGVDFCIGTTATPSADPLEPQLLKLRKKVRLGVDFIQTQAVYDLEDLRKFTEYIRKLDGNVKILAGIVLLVSARMATFMNDNIPGVVVPGDLIDELAAAPRGEALATGIEITGRLIRQIKEEKICDGVHVMAIGREEKIPEILAASGL